MATPTIACKRHKGGEAHIDYTPNAAVAAGDVFDLGDIVGIAEVAIAANVLGALALDGSFTVPKKTGETWTQGQAIYWDAGTATFTNSSSYSEATAGFAFAAAASGDLTGIVELTPGVARS
jgi:predicted RecA/RadA family phage recombinase